MHCIQLASRHVRQQQARRMARVEQKNAQLRSMNQAGDCTLSATMPTTSAYRSSRRPGSGPEEYDTAFDEEPEPRARSRVHSHCQKHAQGAGWSEPPAQTGSPPTETPDAGRPVRVSRVRSRVHSYCWTQLRGAGWSEHPAPNWITS